MGNLIRTFGPRIAGGIVSWLAGLIYVKTKGMVQIDATQVVEVGTLMVGSYAGSHRLLSRVLNPGDAAKGRLAEAEKEAVDTGTVVQPKPPTQ